MTDYDECHPYAERVEESTTREGEKPQDMKEKTWHELDEKV